MEQTAKELIQQLFDILDIHTPFSIAQVDDALEIELTGEENGMLIGYHGETLEALQILIGLMLAKKTGEYMPVSLEVGEYKKNRIEHLKEIIANMKEDVLTQHRPLALPRLKSWERRFVHTYLKDDSEVGTQSEGAGKDRTLTIYPKTA